MRIALATCSNLPDWEVDDRPFHEALKRRDVQIAHAVWDDPTFDWENCDACLIRTTWDYMEKRDAFIKWADRVAGMTRLFNPPEIIRWNTHKSYLRELEERGFPTVPTVWLDRNTRVDLPAVMKERGWARGFIKPIIGAIAMQTLRFDANEEGLAAATRHLEALLPQKDALLQPYLSRVETEGEFSIILFDGQFSHAVGKTPVPGDYRVQDDFGASDRAIEVEPDEIKLVQDIVASVHDDLLYARGDFLRDDSGALCMNELELVEPSLFFRHAPEAADWLADALCRRVQSA